VNLWIMSLDMINMLLFVQDKYNVSGWACHEFAAVWKQLFRHYKLKRRTSNLSCGISGQLLMTHVAYSKVYYWSEIEVVRAKIVMQSAYPSAIERSLLKWNGRDCDGSMHYAIEFYCCHVTTFWNLIGTANFQAAEVTVWTRGSSQAVSPTAWERG